jgi:hypothetical protein
MTDEWFDRQVHKWTGGLADCQIDDKGTKVSRDGLIDGRWMVLQTGA